jgi:cephalosporin hydroxylase
MMGGAQPAVNYFGVSTPQNPASLQNPDELAQFIALLQQQNVRSYLEIGARYGGTFEAVMMALPVGSRGLAVDFPGGKFGRSESVTSLIGAVDRLKKSGRDVDYILGPSAATEVYDWVFEDAFFDAVLIDADHTYMAVQKDYRLYGPLARIVALHDILGEGETDRNGNKIEVPRLWRLVREENWHCRIEEICAPGSKFGIGVIIKAK